MKQNDINLNVLSSAITLVAVYNDRTWRAFKIEEAV